MQEKPFPREDLVGFALEWIENLLPTSHHSILGLDRLTPLLTTSSSPNQNPHYFLTLHHCARERRRRHCAAAAAAKRNAAAAAAAAETRSTEHLQTSDPLLKPTAFSLYQKLRRLLIQQLVQPQRRQQQQQPHSLLGKDNESCIGH